MMDHATAWQCVWLRLPQAVREDLKGRPEGTGPSKLTRRIREILLCPLMRGLDGVSRKLNAEPIEDSVADEMCRRVDGGCERLGLIGQWVATIRPAADAMRREYGQKTLDYDTLYKFAGACTDDGISLATVRADRQALDDLVRDGFRFEDQHDEPDRTPPTRAAIYRLTLDQEFVGSQLKIIDDEFEPGATAYGDGSRTNRERAEDALLNGDVTSDDETLWRDYTDSAPWIEIARSPSRYGLAETDPTPKPSMRPPVWTPDPDALPLDQSVPQRFYRRLEKDSDDLDSVRSLTARELLQQEVHRACRPLGIDEDGFRVLITLGCRVAEVLSDKFAARSNVEPRRLEALSKRIRWRRKFTQDSYRLILPVEVGNRLDNPLPAVMPLLWRAMYGRDYRGEEVPPASERWRLVEEEVWRAAANMAGELQALHGRDRQVDGPHKKSELSIAGCGQVDADASAIRDNALMIELADVLNTAGRRPQDMASGQYPTLEAFLTHLIDPKNQSSARADWVWLLRRHHEQTGEAITSYLDETIAIRLLRDHFYERR